MLGFCLGIGFFLTDAADMANVAMRVHGRLTGGIVITSGRCIQDFDRFYLHRSY